MASDTDFAEYFAARVVKLQRLAYTLCGDWHLADELTQATFVRLYRQWKRVKSETVDAYTRRILINGYLSSRKLRQREQLMAEPPDRPSRNLTGDPLPVDIGRALACLPPRQRALVVLRYLEDVSVAEAAALMGIAEGTVKSQTSRAIQTLRGALGDPAFARSEHRG